MGNAPIDFPRVWKAVTSGMTTEHYWNASGGASDASTGELLPGASRTYLDGTIDSQGTGRLNFITASSISSYVPFRLLTYDSTGSYLVGSAWFDEHTQDCSNGYWLRQSGTIASIPTGSGTTSAIFPIAYTGTTPALYVTASSTSWIITAHTFSVSDLIVGGFTSAYSSLAGAAGTVTLYWESLGTVSSASF